LLSGFALGIHQADCTTDIHEPLHCGLKRLRAVIDCLIGMLDRGLGDPL
jgi:hypothetical protein